MSARPNHAHSLFRTGLQFVCRAYRAARNRRDLRGQGRCRSRRTTCARPTILKLNPEGKVPTLLIDGRPLTEVAAILYYLARRFPDAELVAARRYRGRGAGAVMDVVHRFHAASGAPARAGLRETKSTRSPTGGWEAAGPSGRYSIADIHLFRLYWRLRQFAEARARDLSQSRRALRAHDGPARGARRRSRSNRRSDMNCRRELKHHTPRKRVSSTPRLLDSHDRLRDTGSPAFAGDDSVISFQTLAEIRLKLCRR